MPWTANPLRAGSIPAPASSILPETGLSVSVKSLLYRIFVLVVLGLSVNTQAQPSSTKISAGFHNPLVDAADRGDETEVARLLQDGIPVDSRGDFGMTPLMRAAFKGKTDIVNMLLQAGADVDAVDLGGASAMHLAVRQGNTDIIKILFQADAMADIPDDEGWTPLMRASIAKKTSVIPVLLEHGASIVKTNNAGDDSLTLAVQSGDTNTMGLFADTHAFGHIAPTEAKKLLKIANQRNNSQMVALLSDHLDEQVVESVLVAQAAPLPAPVVAQTPKTVPTQAPVQVAQYVAPPTPSAPIVALAQPPATPPKAVVAPAPVIVAAAVPAAVVAQPPAAVQVAAAPPTKPAPAPAIALVQPAAPPKVVAAPVPIITVAAAPAETLDVPSKESPLVKTLMTPFRALAAVSSSATAGNDPFIASAHAAETPEPEPSSDTAQVPTIVPTTAVTIVDNAAPLPWISDKKPSSETAAKPQKVSPAAPAPQQPVAPKAQEIAVSDTAPLPWLAAKPSAPANKTTSTPTSQKGKRVEVAEAIRVPLTNNAAPAGKPLKVKPATGYSPSNSRTMKNTLWLQVGPYANEDEALENYENVKSNPLFEGMRVRVISAISAYNTPGSSLSIGPVEQEDVSSLCGMLVRDGITCSIARDTGKSTNLTHTRGGVDNYVQPENRRTSGKAGTGKYWAQLGTFESEDEAVAHRNRLKSRYATTFSPLSFTISVPRSGSNQQGAFRLRAGTFTSSEMASAFCTKLSDQGIECIAIRD